MRDSVSNTEIFGPFANQRGGLNVITCVRLGYAGLPSLEWNRPGDQL